MSRGFSCFRASGWVRRRTNEALLDSTLSKTVKHGGGKINVWGCFHAGGVGFLKRIEGNMDTEYRNILVQKAIPKIKELLNTETKYVAWVFQHDRDPKHTANLVTAYLAKKQDELGFRVLDWPASPPDMNPIEHIWAYLKQQLRKRPVKPQNLDDLYNAIVDEWERIPQRILNNLVESMPRRIQAVIDNKGGSTRF